SLAAGLYRFTRSIRSYCRSIGGLGRAGDPIAFSIACETMLRLRPNGARARDWFCIRGRSVEERAISILIPAPMSGTYPPRISWQSLMLTSAVRSPHKIAGAGWVEHCETQHVSRGVGSREELDPT